ncbi:single-stranded DNA-binding protein [Listeriaceae bacterium FSL A5-0209]|nr:single-stranded DNA-binding protein [Listeriaceae bacterium FSL A5-0209]
MMNMVGLEGRLTKDPEMRYTPSGVAVATFTLAVNRSFTNEQGEREADFIQCVAWRKQAELVADSLKKGSLVGIQARIQTRYYDGADGKRVYVTEVVVEKVHFLEARNARGNAHPAPSDDQAPPSYGRNQEPSRQPTPSGAAASTAAHASSYQGHTDADQPIDISDDDLPF